MLYGYLIIYSSRTNSHYTFPPDCIKLEKSILGSIYGTAETIRINEALETARAETVSGMLLMIKPSPKRGKEISVVSMEPTPYFGVMIDIAMFSGIMRSWRKAAISSAVIEARISGTSNASQPWK